MITRVLLLTGLLLHQLFIPVSAQVQAPPEQKITVNTLDVLVDVVARDKRNRFVKDLTKDDFEIYEDGVQQKLDSFRLVTRELTRMKPNSAATSGDNQPKINASNATPAAVAPSNISAVALVFQQLMPETRTYATKAAQAYVNENLSAKDYVGVFVANQSLQAVQPYTTDMKQVQKAIDDVSKMAFSRTMAFAGQVKDTNRSVGGVPDFTASGLERDTKVLNEWAFSSSPNTRAAQAQGDPDVLMKEFSKNSLLAFEQLERERQGLVFADSLLAIIAAQKQLPGRKAIVLFSEGVSLPTNVRPWFENIISSANKANVSIYTVDAAGLRVDSLESESRRQLGSLAANSTLRADTEQSQMRGAQSKDFERNEDLVSANQTTGLLMLANGTGGAHISNTNDLKGQIGRIDEDLRAYYLLSYVPSNQNYNGKFRQIEVKLKRNDLKLQSRKGYFAINPSASPAIVFETPVLAAMNNAPAAVAFPMQTRNFTFPGENALTQVPVLMQIPVNGITLKEDSQTHLHAADVRVVVLIKDQTGQVVKKLSQQFQLSIPAEKLTEARNTAINFAQETQLPAGTYQVEAAAFDALSNQLSLARNELEITAFAENQIRLSSIGIIKQLTQVPKEQKLYSPFLFGNVLLYPNLGSPYSKAAKQMPFYFTIYLAKGSTFTPQLTVELAQNDVPLATVPLQVPPPNTSGKIPYLGNLPLESLAPGEYDLRVTVRDDKGSATKVTKFILIP